MNIKQALIETGFIPAPIVTFKSYTNKTAEEVKAELNHNGISIAAWAAANGFSYSMVLEVLAGRKKGVRGQAHKIMVKLGMKEGEVVADNQIANMLKHPHAA